MLFDIHNIIFQDLRSDLLSEKQLELWVARLDKIHPVASGNKLFKLHYFLETYKKGHYKSIKTFGGAYSNHLVATAHACRQLNIPCKGIIRGEQPVRSSHTLQQCIAYGMQLEFIPRGEYAATAALQENAGDVLTIPEGGFHPEGARGASLIMDALKKNYSHICMAVGTATTLAGILQKAAPQQNIIAIPVLKAFTDINERLMMLNKTSAYSNFETWAEYHFGGYAKKTPGLIAFMNELYAEYSLPTDFVYTAKMMFGVMEKIKENYFPAGSNVLCLHTGGLQGNDSLPAGTLIF